MGRLSLFQMPFSEFGLKDAVCYGLRQGVNTPLSSQFSIENSLESSVKHHIQNGLKKTSFNGQSHICPPNNGLRTKFMLTLQIQINYKVSFKTGLHAGLEYRSGDFHTNQSLHFSFGNTGLGTPIYTNDREKRMKVADATVYLGIGIGKGEAKPMKQYVINYDTPMPLQNTFKYSGSYGQALTWNSSINQRFDLQDVQRQGIWNVRIGDFSLSTNNDTKIGYFGGGTDYGWTGGLLLSFNVARFGIIEAGYQNFTGKYDEKGYQERKMDSLNKLKEEGIINKNRFEKERNVLLKKYPYHTQDRIQKSFNRASNFLRIHKDMYSIRLDLESDGWFQNFIHEQIGDFKFKYDNPKPIGIWIEKAF